MKFIKKQIKHSLFDRPTQQKWRLNRKSLHHVSSFVMLHIDQPSFATVSKIHIEMLLRNRETCSLFLDQ